MSRDKIWVMLGRTCKDHLKIHKCYVFFFLAGLRGLVVITLKIRMLKGRMGNNHDFRRHINLKHGSYLTDMTG